MNFRAIFAVIATIVTAAVLLLVTLGLPLSVPAQGEAPYAQNTDEIGTAFVNWVRAPGATHYRVGWVNMDEFNEFGRGNPDWLDLFYFRDIKDTGQGGVAVTGLTPGVEYAFITTGLTGRFSGVTGWSEWHHMSTTPQVASCPTQRGPDLPSHPGNTPTPRPICEPAVTPAATPTPALPQAAVTLTDDGFIAYGSGYPAFRERKLTESIELPSGGYRMQMQFLHEPDGALRAGLYDIDYCRTRVACPPEVRLSVEADDPSRGCTWFELPAREAPYRLELGVRAVEPWELTVTASDESCPADIAVLRWTAKEPPVRKITGGEYFDLTVIGATGGIPPYTYTISRGLLGRQPGIQYEVTPVEDAMPGSDLGRIYGTPNPDITGGYGIHKQVVDAAGHRLISTFVINQSFGPRSD